MRKRIIQLALLTLVLGAVGVLFVLRPGGPVTWVITSGTSMAPLLDDGDLVLVRKRDDYAVGSVVAYRSADLKHTVLHRIVGEEAGRYVLKGDANSWTDSTLPTTREVAGEMLVRVPDVGRLLSASREPRVAATLAGAVAFLAAGGLGRQRLPADAPT